MSERTIMFADLCGFTKYTCLHGDEAAARLALSFHRRAQTLARAEGCSFVKSIGDAVMVQSDDCRAAVRLAYRLLALSADEGYPPVRAGIDIGPAVEFEGDWFGSTVNTAARLASAAAPSELVVTDRVRAAVAGVAPVALRRRGPRQLKGLPELQLHSAAVA
jgi:adenylate cyclase